VRRDDDGRAQPIQGSEQVKQPMCHVRIHVSGRFVGHQKLGLAHDGPSDGDALLLSTGQCGRPGAGPVGKSDPCKHLPDRSFDFGVALAGDTEGERDIVEGGQVADQPEVLKHDADSPAVVRKDVSRGVADVLPEQPDPSARRPPRQIEELQE